MSPEWKEYTCAEWDKLCGLSPDFRCRETGRFIFNEKGVCINPHVLGIVGHGWRIAVLTAQTPSGLWAHSRDIFLPTGGYGYLPGRLDFNARTTEDEARMVELDRVAEFIIREADPNAVSCPISKRDASILLRLIREKIDELSAPKLPTYTQLSLW